MITTDSLLQLANDVESLLTRYVAVHDACFKFSLRRVIPIPWIFQAVNFKRLHLDLADIYIQLQETKEAVDAALAKSGIGPEWTRFLLGLSQYAGLLTTTVGWLSTICSKLADKSSGSSYKATTYKDDLAGYRTSVERYLAKGAELNGLLRTAVASSPVPQFDGITGRAAAGSTNQPKDARATGSQAATDIPESFDLENPAHVALMEEIRCAYGTALDRGNPRFPGCMYTPAADLPYPKEAIRRALTAYLDWAENRRTSRLIDFGFRTREFADLLRSCLMYLDQFLDIPPESIPTDTVENSLFGQCLKTGTEYRPREGTGRGASA